MAIYQPKPTNPSFKDITGKVVGRLTVTGYLGRRGESQIWECCCECGTIITSATTASLLSGHTRSCGCLRRDATRKRATTHGHCIGPNVSLEYASYQHMKSRCYTPTSQNFSLYGGRGITVCEQWLGDHGFTQFMADMGPAPAGHSIERKDVNGNYCPENCCWIPLAEQARNTRKTIRLTTNDGRTMRLDQWAAETGIAAGTMRSRLRRGWSPHDAVTTRT
jgi:hypothetical protein